MSETRTGKKHTQITKDRIGKAHRGRVVSKQTRGLIGQSSKHRNINPEYKVKIEEALRPLNLETLPMYIGYRLDKRHNRNVDVICVRGPGIKTKKFAAKGITLTEKITRAIEYKKSILNGHRSEGSSQPQ